MEQKYHRTLYFALLFFYTIYHTGKFFKHSTQDFISDIGHTVPKTFFQTPRRFLQKDTPSLINDLARANSCTKTGLTVALYGALLLTKINRLTSIEHIYKIVTIINIIMFSYIIFYLIFKNKSLPSGFRGGHLKISKSTKYCNIYWSITNVDW